jgi:hypothetical protein
VPTAAPVTNINSLSYSITETFIYQLARYDMRPRFYVNQCAEEAALFAANNLI